MALGSEPVPIDPLSVCLWRLPRLKKTKRDTPNPLTQWNSVVACYINNDVHVSRHHVLCASRARLTCIWTHMQNTMCFLANHRHLYYMCVQVGSRTCHFPFSSPHSALVFIFTLRFSQPSFPPHQCLINLTYVQSLDVCSRWDQVNLWKKENIS